METNKTVRSLLIDLAEKEDSNLAKILAFYYPKLNFLDKKALFENLFYHYKITTDYNFDKIKEDDKTKSISDKYYNKDFRIKSFEISNLRGIPEKDDDIPFGMNFFLNSKFNNAVILANNGVGKSSIFAGLEMIYTQEIGEKRLRTSSKHLDKKEYSDYLKRFPYEKPPECIVQTNEGEFSLNNSIFEKDALKSFNPANHFISDYDIYNNGQIDYAGKADSSSSFHSLIANSLGLSEFISLESILQELKTYRRTTEKSAYNKLTGEYSSLRDNINKWETEKVEKSKELLSLKENSGKEGLVKSTKTPKEIARELLNKQIRYTIDKKLFEKQLSNFYNSYISYQSIEKNDNIEKEMFKKDFLEIGLELIHNETTCPFCLDSKKDLGEIKINVQSRVDKLKTVLIHSENIKENFKLLMETLSSFIKESIDFLNFIRNESVDILSINNLKELLEKENEYILSLSNLLLFEDEQLVDLLISLNDRPRPKETDFKVLFDLINDYRDLFFTIIPSKIDETINLISLRTEILNQISKTEENIESNSVEKTIILYEEELKKLTNAIVEGKKRLEVLKPQIESAKKDYELVDKIKNEVTEFLPLYSYHINELVNAAFEPIKDSVESILGRYLTAENENKIQFRIGRNEYKVIVDDEEFINHNIVAKLDLIDELTGEVKEITPDKYFNSFRYKLFCLMVSLSLALSTRKKYQINLPLVIDDIFYSSDFVNKHTFADFIINVIKLFTKHTPNMPLQFILLTHDDLIFKCAIDGLSHLNPDIANEDTHIMEKTLIGRYFSPKDKDDSPSRIEETNKLYWNLLYKLPQNIIDKQYN